MEEGLAGVVGKSYPESGRSQTAKGGQIKKTNNNNVGGEKRGEERKCGCLKGSSEGGGAQPRRPYLLQKTGSKIVLKDFNDHTVSDYSLGGKKKALSSHPDQGQDALNRRRLGKEGRGPVSSKCAEAWQYVHLELRPWSARHCT